MTICRKQAEEILDAVECRQDAGDALDDYHNALLTAGAFDNTRVLVARALRALLSATLPTVQYRDAMSIALRDGVETLVASLEAGIVRGPDAAQVGDALRAEGVSATQTVYVLRVLTKLGVL